MSLSELDAADQFEIDVNAVTKSNEHYCNFCFQSEFSVLYLAANFSGMTPIVAPLVRICDKCVKETIKDFAARSSTSVPEYLGFKQPPTKPADCEAYDTKNVKR